jgi:sialidase-1
VLVDTFGGAYPSIVDRKDGTELIVYYEEGSGSSIRVKRFRAMPHGIQWLPVARMPKPEPRGR